MNSNGDSVDYLGFRQGARIKGVSVSLLRREASAGRLRTRRVFKRRLTTPKWLDEWFESVAEPVTEPPRDGDREAA